MRDPVQQGLDQRASSTATAMTARPSPRPMNPMPSLVFALTLTAPEATPSRDGERRGHGGQVRREPGLLGDDRAVGLRQGEAAAADQLVRGAQQLHRIGVLPLGIAVGKQLADVARARGAEDGVGEGVRHGVGVRVPGEPARMGDGDAAEDERTARDEAVGVVADPHPGHARPAPR